MTIVIVIYCLMRVKMSGLFVLYQTGGEEKPSKALAVLSFLMLYVALVILLPIPKAAK